jgi:hypothetical protein
MPRFYLTPKQDDYNQELQVCIAEYYNEPLYSRFADHRGEH